MYSDTRVDIVMVNIMRGFLDSNIETNFSSVMIIHVIIYLSNVTLTTS